jgi:hypothetical protein
MGMCCFSGLFADDAPKQSVPTKTKRSLPAGWGKLGLSDQQKQRIMQIQAGMGGRIEMLQKQVKDMQEAEKRAMYQVLTDAQKAQLKEIIASKAGEVKEDSKSDTAKEKGK